MNELKFLDDIELETVLMEKTSNLGYLKANLFHLL